MSDTLTLTQKTQTVTEKTIPIPSFFKETVGGSYIAILSREVAVAAYYSRDCNSIFISDPATLSGRLQNSEPSDQETFFKVYYKCLDAVIAKAVPPVLA